MTSSRASAYAILTLLFALAAPAAGLQLFEAVEPHMGTLVRISLYTDSEEHAKSAFRAAFDRIAELDGILSDYRPESELNRVCREAASQPVAVSGDLFHVLAASQQISEETGGAFDVTFGPVTRLWRQARREKRAPSHEALQEARERSGFRKLQLDPAAHSVTLAREGMQLDVGAIGKGYAADAALAVLAARSITRALVAASGDLAFGDPPPGKRGWRIGVDSLEGTEGFARVLELSNAAVSTSGAREQHVELDGHSYSHVVDPATGMGLTVPLSVTVIARRGIDSDALSTAVSVLGPERGMALIERHPDAAAMLVNGGKVSVSSRWGQLYEAKPR